MIEFEEHIPQKNGLDLTPMIDVVFLLLIFFLLTSVSSKMTIPMSLPEAETPVLASEASVVVAIKSDGGVHVNGKPVDMQDLYALLKDMYQRSADRELSLMSDKTVIFDRVVDVMDIARKAGALNIAIVTEQKSR